MKTKFIIYAIVLVSLIGCIGSNSKSSTNNTESKSLDLADVQPPPTIESVDMGLIPMDANGYSIGSKTEMTTLKKMLNSNNDIIIINWTWDCKPPYNDMPMCLTYNKNNNSLVVKYRSTGVDERYSGVPMEALNAFLNANEKSFYSLEKYSNDVKYALNNNVDNQAEGAKPEQSPVDGSVSEVVRFIKLNTANPNSIKLTEWSKVNASGKYWVVRCKVAGKNKFNFSSTEFVWFYIQNGKIVQLKAEDGVLRSVNY